MYQNTSYWEQTAFFKDYDVIIIGSGIVGLSAALHLKVKQPKLRVALLEAGFLPAGASTKNAGFACFGSVSELLDELQKSSEDQVLQVIEMRWNGLQKLRKTLGDRAIDYQEFGGFEIFKSGDSQTFESCSEQIPYLNNLLKGVIGSSAIYADATEKISDFGFNSIEGMIVNRWEGQINTGKMMRALLAKVLSTGVYIFNNCTLHQFYKNHSMVYLNTDHGVFETRKLLMANNAFVNTIFPKMDVVSGRGQVLITGPIAGLKIKGAFHYDCGYYYFRNIHNRILLGGGRNINFKAEETIEPGVTQPVQAALENLLHEHILAGQNFKITHRWSGVMGFGEELKPIVKQVEPHVFCAVRCNGMGVAIGSLMGEQIANLVLADI